MKRMIFILMYVLVVAYSSLCAQEMSQPLTGDGTKENPYQISSAAELRWFANEVNENGQSSICAKLTQDIDLNPGFTFDENGYNGVGMPVEWTKPIGPIGSYGGYSGIFDGCGYVIRGIYINDQTLYENGAPLGQLSLFSLIDENGIIKNLSIENSYIMGVGIVNEKGSICTFNEGTISNCSNAAIVVINLLSNAGGICAANTGTIINCYNSGKIIVRNDNGGSSAGGICGDNSGVISDCYNVGSVISTGCGDFGGICGKNRGSTTEVSIVRNCYNAGVIAGPKYVYTYVGGIIGNGQSKSVIINCFNMGIIVGENSGGMFGICYEGYQNSISNSFYLEGMSEQSIGYGKVDIGSADVKSVQNIVNQMIRCNSFTSENGWKTSASYRNGLLILPALDDKVSPTIMCYAVDVRTSLGGAVSSLGGTYAEGANITVTAIPEDNYKFVGWKDARGMIVCTDESYTFTITSDISLTANFEKEIVKQYYAINVSANTGGIVNILGGTYEEGENVTIIATPNNGYHFENWTNDATGQIVSTQETYTFNVTSDISLSANFERDVYSVHITESPDISLWADKYSVYWNESVIIHAQLIGESSDTDKIKVLYKRGENGLWETVYGSNDFYIYNVYSDIYVRAERYTYVANEVIADKGIQIYTQNGCLYVQTFKLQQVHIIALNGTIVRSRKQSGLQCYDGLEPGVYLVRVDKRTFKVLVTK